MSVFNELQKSQKGLPDRNEMSRLVGQLQSNPAGFLRSMGYNVPDGIDFSNPNSIISHLMQSNQINGGLLGKAQSLLGLFR